MNFRIAGLRDKQKDFCGKVIFPTAMVFCFEVMRRGGGIVLDC